MTQPYTVDDVARCCTLGLLLELAITPKPGLVDRSSNPILFSQFMSSSISLYKHFRDAAEGRSVGGVVFDACKDMLYWQHGGNTHLGALLLLTPLAKAAAGCNKFAELGTCLRFVLKNMDYTDTLGVFKAIKNVNPSHLGHVAYLDVYRDKTYVEITKRRITVLDALQPYKGFEVVATEYSTCYRNSFTHGYSYLKKQVRKTDLNTAGINTFLNILKHLPDSHVARMHGGSAARMLSRMAGEVLDAGGAATAKGRAMLQELAEKISSAGFKPAATADVLAVSFTLLLLSGWRP
ncbi:MAG: triphosphoribosyl-dephospho-CoA synthase [Candidatus Caldarchaeum sp.]